MILLSLIVEMIYSDLLQSKEKNAKNLSKQKLIFWPLSVFAETVKGYAAKPLLVLK